MSLKWVVFIKDKEKDSFIMNYTYSYFAGLVASLVVVYAIGNEVKNKLTVAIIGFLGYFAGMLYCGMVYYAISKTKRRKMNKITNPLTKFKLFLKKESTQSFIIFYLVPLFFGWHLFKGFLYFLPEYQNIGKLFSKDAFNFIWGVIILALIVGTLVLNIRLDKKRKSDIEIERVGFLIIIFGVIILFSLMFQGYLLSKEGFNNPLSVIGVQFATIGGWLLISSLVMLFFRIIERLITSFK